MRFAAAVLSCLLLLSAHAEELTPPDAETLARRAGALKEEAKAHKEALARKEAERLALLEELQIAEVVRLGQHGDPARCVDIAFIGDGFAEDDQKEFAAVIDRMAKNFDTPPFDALATHINLYRVSLVSEESGIRLDDNEVTPPLGGTVVSAGKLRLLRCDQKEAVRRVRAVAPEVDYVMVVLNTFGKFRGSANSTGTVVLLSTAGGHKGSIVVHEFGHYYVNLLDEYVDPKQGGNRPPPPQVENAYNVSLESNVHVAKWHHWNIPEDVFRGRKRGKPFQPEDNVRCYEGAATFLNDVYRAEEWCHMQRGRGKAFCRQCCEAMELGTYRYFTPVASVLPYEARIEMTLKQNVEFTVAAARLEDAATTQGVSWYLDGKRLDPKKAKIVEPTDAPSGRQYVYKLRGSSFGAGAHELTAVLDVITPRMHMDRGWLSASWTWQVNVTTRGPALTAPSRRICTAGQPLDLVVEVPANAAPGPWTLLNPPEDAAFDEDTGALQWTTGEEDIGAHRLLFARSGGAASEVHAIQVTVKPVEKRGNKGPKFLFLPDQDVTAGDILAVGLWAYDPDGDHLAWSAKDLPPRARLDPDTGCFTWDVGHTQRGAYELAFEVTDGRKTDKKSITVTVTSSALKQKTLALADDADRMLVGLHLPDPGRRLLTTESLARAPRQAVLAESLRLLREVHPDLSAWARTNLGRIFEEAAAAEDTWHLGMFLDQMPQRIWQFVDRQQDLDAVRGWCKTALASSVTRTLKKDLEALLADIELIETYNEEREARDPQPPITDKKYK